MSRKYSAITLQVLVFVLLLQATLTIKFNYNASKHEHICFHEQVQKQSRYQVIIKSEKSNYGLQIFQQKQSVYEDERLDTYIKYYSAFSKIQGVLLICLSNKNVEEPIYYQIEFYHGSHLEGLMNDLAGDSLSQLEDIYGQTNEMQRFVQSAYEMNANTLLERNQIVQGLWTWATVTAVLLFIILAVSRGILVLRLKKMLRAKKLI